jgi:hypothetical protein
VINTKDKIKLDVNMRENPTNLTWEHYADTIKIKLMNTDVDMTLDLGPEIVRQLMQALSWVDGPSKKLR